jgi:hypothetical protein
MSARRDSSASPNVFTGRITSSTSLGSLFWTLSNNALQDLNSSEPLIAIIISIGYAFERIGLYV